MPVIFDGEKRERVRETLLKNGFNLIKKFGMKKTSIEEITKNSGIAKGTFYNFFNSKEEFVAEIILFKRNKFKKEFTELIQSKGTLNKQDVIFILDKIVNNEESLYPYLTEEDLTILSTRVPGFIAKEENVEQTTNLLLNYIPNKSSACDWRVVANYVKILVLTEVNKNLLLQDGLIQAQKGIISLVIKEIFKSESIVSVKE